MSTGLRWLSHEMGLRFLMRRKVTLVVAILTLGLALGATTTAFSVLNTFLLSSIGVPDADRLMLVAPLRALPGRGDVLFFDAFPNYQLVRATQRASFAELATTFQGMASWSDGDEARPLQFARVTATFFETMRVFPALGRSFQAREEGPSPAPVVVVGHTLWTSALGGDRAVLGRSMVIDGVPHTIVGVMPAGFVQPAPTDIWLPFDIPAPWRAAVTGARQLTVFARLADSIPTSAASRIATAITARALKETPDNKDFRYELQPIRSVLLATAAQSVLLVQVSAGVLLLLAVMNLGSLLVAWTFDRQQEMAVRRALGAERGRIARMLFLQSAFVVGCGAAVGLLLARLAIPLLQRLDINPQLTYFTQRIEFDRAVFGVSVVIAALSALVIGAIPAWLGGRTDLSNALRSGSRAATLSRPALRWQQGVVAVQTALSVAVLAIATLLVVSYLEASSVRPGYTPRNLVVARVHFPGAATHAQRAALIASLEQALAQEPSIGAFGTTSTLPVSDIVSGGRFTLEPPGAATNVEPMLLHYRRVSPTYLQTMRIPLIEGRLLDARDDTSGQAVLVVSRALAERIWPNQSAIGRRLYRATGPAGEAFEVVGVVGNVMDAGTRAPAGETVYVPWSRLSTIRASIVFEPRGPTASAIEAFRRALRLADPSLAASGVATLQDLVDQADALPRLQTLLLLFFALMAVGITALGSYGVMSQLVATREREYALRLVFGATPVSIGRGVYVLNARLVVPGIIVGLVAVALLAEVLRPFVFQVEPASVPMLAIAGIGLSVIAAIAALPPTVRAMRVDVTRSIGAG